MSLRLLTWNIRDLLGDPLAVHRVIRAARADVVCLQETPRWPLETVRLHLLERGTGLRRVAGGRRYGATAVFVAPSVRVEWAQAFRLPVPNRLVEARGACVVDLSVPAVGKIALANVHLPLREADRLDHVAKVCQVLAWRGHQVVVAGDLNEPPGAPAWTAWSSLATDPWPDTAPPTFPAAAPSLRIDAVLVAPTLRAVAPDAVPWQPDDVLRASDHQPVLAEIIAASPTSA